MMGEEVRFRIILVIIDRLNLLLREKGGAMRNKTIIGKSKQKYLKTKILICFVSTKARTIHKCHKA